MEGSEGGEVNGFCIAAIDTCECCPVQAGAPGTENPPLSPPWKTVITRSSAQTTAAKMAGELSLVGRRPRESSNKFAALQSTEEEDGVKLALCELEHEDVGAEGFASD